MKPYRSALSGERNSPPASSRRMNADRAGGETNTSGTGAIVQMQRQLGNQAVARLLSDRARRSEAVQRRTQPPIQRTIVGPGRANIWSSEIAGKLESESNSAIVEAVHRLHSIRTDVIVENYDSLVHHIQHYEYDHLLAQSREESPDTAKYDSLDRPISHPIVPKGEEDPRQRINVMIDMFNDSLPPRNKGSIDKGLYHEIQTALRLVREYRVTHGNQISRGLTDSEKRMGRKGTEQMILTPKDGDKYRELDMVFPGETGAPTIVEAKNKKTVDTHQVEENRKLAEQVDGSLMYSLAGEKEGQAQAIRKKLESSGSESLPALEIMMIESDHFSELYHSGEVGGLAHIPTLEAIMDESFNPDSGGYHDSEE